MIRDLHASRLLTATGELSNPLLTLDPNGAIASVAPNPHPGADDTTLTPAFLDIHTHGAVGHDVMSATPAELSAIGRFLATHGVAYFLPTTVTAPVDTTLASLERLADAIECGPQPLQAQPIGIHLEGPFLSHSKRGVHPTEYLQTPSVELLDRFQQAARGHILLLTLAPELPNALDLIAHAAAQGVRVSLGHTNALAAETLAAIDAGAASATHTFNAMRALDHREPGILGTTLDDDRLYAELICDGIHVAPPLVRLWWRAKAPNRAILITDAMAATGCGDGNFSLGGLPVTVKDRRPLLTLDLQAGKETIAGSALTLDNAVANLQRFTRSTLAEAVRAVTQTPAAMIGRPELASLTPGSLANLNRFDPSGRLIATYLHGEQVQAQP